MPAAKPCRGCNQVLPLEQFYRSRRSRDGLTSRCRRCYGEANHHWLAANKERKVAYTREYRQRNREKVRQWQWSRRLTKYGLSRQEYEALAAQHNERCAICAGDNDQVALCVDHDHASGLIRGLLCRRCNAVIGFAGDSAQRLRNAATYLRRSAQEVRSCV